MGNFAEIISAKITSGLIETENAIVNNVLIAKIIKVDEKIISPIVETDNLKVKNIAEIKQVITDEIKPQTKDVTINLQDKGQLSKLIIKGLEGTIVGSLSHKLQGALPYRSLGATISVVIGGLEMVFGYFLYEQLALGYPLAAALVEVPFNLIQMGVGLVIAIPVVHAVRQVVPQLKS